MNATEIYDKLSRPDPDALKKITGGRLSGKTDINPQWRYRAMTEQFGLIGFGWKYIVDRQWTETGYGGEVMAFVNISVYVKVDGEWSEAIPGSGGSMLVAKESKGLYNSDEAYKMATTDALGVALKFLGVASAIYAGQWDGTKYINDRVAKVAEGDSEEVKGKLAEYVASGLLSDKAVTVINAAINDPKSTYGALIAMLATAKLRYEEAGGK